MRQRPEPLAGFIVTWDVNSRDRASCSRLRRFVFGYALRNDGKRYVYQGFVARTGVRYLGQSVLFATSPPLAELIRFLNENGIQHHVTRARLG